MAKKKWHVVIVGREIGVFATWIEAGPLVKGVPDAVNQSFSTSDEAHAAFAAAQAAGRTRVVNPDAPPSPNQRHRHGAHNVPVMARQHIVVHSRTTSTASRTHRSDTTSVPATRTRASSTRNHSAPSVTASSRSSGITRSSSEPSPSEVRLRTIQAALDAYERSSSVGVEAAIALPVRLPSKSKPKESRGATASTSTANGLSSKSRSRSHSYSRAPSPASSTSSIHIVSHHPTKTSSPKKLTPKKLGRTVAIVQDPPWLEDYPTAPPSPSTASSALLSPLNSDDLPLRSLRIRNEAHGSPAKKHRKPRNSQSTPKLPNHSPVSSVSTPRTNRKEYDSNTPKARTPKPLVQEHVASVSEVLRKSHDPKNSKLDSEAHSRPRGTSTSASSPSTPRRKVKSPSSSSSHSTPQQSSGGFSTIYMNSPADPVISHLVEHEEDPRSPILHRSQVPEIRYLNFARPSPQPAYRVLPSSPFPSNSGLAATSLLFKSSPPSPLTKMRV